MKTACAADTVPNCHCNYQLH